MDKKVRLLDLGRLYCSQKKEIDDSLAACLASQEWILGKPVALLEEKVAAYMGSAFGVGCASGTDALVLALRALALKTKGTEYFKRTDRIITSPFTFTATGDAILRAGATPAFVDIDPATFNLDMRKVDEALDAVEGVAGIIPVHLFGQPCDMEALRATAEAGKFFIVEDTAQSMGARWKGKYAASIGNAGCLSFFPSKNLGCFGDGGMVVTNDRELAETVRMLTKHGGKDKYNVDHIGYNSRLDTIQAAVLNARLPALEGLNASRRRIAERYLRQLKEEKKIALPVSLPDACHVYNQFTVRVPGRRDEVQKKLAERGVSSAVYYPMPLHRMRVFQGQSVVHGELAEAEKACEEVLSLPMDPLLEDREIDFVCESLKEVLK